MSSTVKQVVVTGAFDDLRSGEIRFLEEASKLGAVTVLLWTDEQVQQFEGRGAKFPAAERAYFLRAIRFVHRVLLAWGRSEACPTPGAEPPPIPGARSETGLVAAALEQAGIDPDLLVVREQQGPELFRALFHPRGIECRVVRDEDLRGFPEAFPEAPSPAPGRKRVMVTGCYDWVHSGHVRFFEEVSAYGDLYVVLGHDANIRLLKGAGHPLLPEAERRYVVGAIRHVTQALVATGDGWLDAEPEIRRLKPDIYAVNEDGDKGGKREYCAKQGIEYLVLKRTPAHGLPRRTSTDLRGF